MNPVKAYVDQQYGYVQNKNWEPYLSRLRCLKTEDFCQIYSAEDGSGDTPIFACKFSEKKGFENLLALANEDGKIAVYNVKTKEERMGLHAHNNAIFDLCWLFQQLKIVTASGDHTSKLYNVSNSHITEERTFFRHERSVKSIASSKFDPSIFATGGRDGNIILWDIRAENSDATVIGKSDKIIQKSHVSKILTPSRTKKNIPIASQNNSVTGLVFQDCNTLISCGAGDGCIKIWDLRKTHYNCKREPLPKFSLPYPGKSAKNGFSNLIVDSECLRLYANCLDNNIYCYNIGTYNTTPTMVYSGHQNNTFYIKSALSFDGSYLISGSSDENAYIWNVKNSQPICRLTGHTAEVTCVAWYHNLETCIVTCSDDIKHKIWRIGTEHVPEDFDIEGRGQTEVLPKFSENVIMKKRVNLNEFQSVVDHKKFIISCERCSSGTSNDRFCENCNYTTKRKTACDPIEPKRLNEFGPRKLFGDLKDIVNVEISTDTSHKKRKYENTIFSPLKDLPNYVIDGVAPHLNFSPPKKKHCDWLTKLRIDYSFKRKMVENFEEPVTKAMKLDITPKNKTPSRVLKSPLLKYFKLTNNNLKCDKHSTILKSCNSCVDLSGTSCVETP